MNTFLLVVGVLVSIVLAGMAGYQINQDKLGGEDNEQ